MVMLRRCFGVAENLIAEDIGARSRIGRNEFCGLAARHALIRADRRMGRKKLAHSRTVFQTMQPSRRKAATPRSGIRHCRLRVRICRESAPRLIRLPRLGACRREGDHSSFPRFGTRRYRGLMQSLVTCRQLPRHPRLPHHSCRDGITNIYFYASNTNRSHKSRSKTASVAPAQDQAQVSLQR